jgi:predicted DNA-binding ribbon-helix-helix protein
VTYLTLRRRIGGNPLKLIWEGRWMRKRQGKGAQLQQQLVRIKLDPIIWKALQDIAAQQARSVRDLISEIARDSLYVAIHVYIAEFYRSDAAEEEPDAERC